MENKPSIDSIHIIKHKRILHLMKGDDIVRSYTVCLGKNPVGAKQFEGDQKTPEGIYTIYHKSTESSFYKSLGISYPGEKEKKYAESMNQSPGGQIRIHGFKNGYEGNQVSGKQTDWTEGCIAVTDAEMDEIYDWIEVGTPVLIEP